MDGLKRIEDTMLPRFVALRGALCAFLLVCTGAAAQQGQPVPVGVVKVAPTPVEPAMEFVGRVSAIERVEVRARVKGFLEAVLFKEGDTIKKGAPLYRIEKGQFDADVKQAEGALLRSKAAKELSVDSVEARRGIAGQADRHAGGPRPGDRRRPAGAGPDRQQRGRP